MDTISTGEVITLYSEPADEMADVDIDEIDEIDQQHQATAVTRVASMVEIGCTRSHSRMDDHELDHHHLSNTAKRRRRQRCEDDADDTQAETTMGRGYEELQQETHTTTSTISSTMMMMMPLEPPTAPRPPPGVSLPFGITFHGAGDHRQFFAYDDDQCTSARLLHWSRHHDDRLAAPMPHSSESHDLHDRDTCIDEDHSILIHR